HRHQPTLPMDHSDRVQPSRLSTNPRYQTTETTSSRRSPFSIHHRKQRRRRMHASCADSPQSTSHAPIRRPAQSSETSAPRTYHHSSPAFSPPPSAPLSSPAWPLSSCCLLKRRRPRFFGQRLCRASEVEWIGQKASMMREKWRERKGRTISSGTPFK